MRTILPLTVLVTAMCLCTVAGFYKGKHSADRCIYVQNQFPDSGDGQWAYPQVRTLGGVPKNCNVPGDAFVLESNGRLFVCVFATDKEISYGRVGGGRWIGTVPTAYAAPKRNGKE